MYTLNYIIVLTHVTPIKLKKKKVLTSSELAARPFWSHEFLPGIIRDCWEPAGLAGRSHAEHI